MEKQVSLAFPTPIGKFRIPEAAEVNTQLRAVILAREQAQSSQTYSNVGGWHSAQDLLTWKEPVITTLRGWILEAVNHMIGATVEMVRNTMGLQAQPAGKLHAIAWANVSRDGHYHSIHNHPLSVWSGVYYVEVGKLSNDQPVNGALELLDPRPYTEMVPVPGNPYGQRALIRPEVGLMVVFPGWLYHFVNPYHGEGERISISFNVMSAG